MSDFFRFPHTPHLAWLGQGEPRDDKVMPPAQAAALLATEVVLEEKVDGANLGFSLSNSGALQAQNRGQYLQVPFSGQFVRLPAWLAVHAQTLQAELLAHANDKLMLFGEWCAARHSLNYDRLPDWYLLFDVFDQAKQVFWSSARRDAVARRLGLVTVPRFGRGRYTLGQLKTMLIEEPSRFRDGELEGIVIRRESPTECIQRAKLVRASFTQGIEDHWRNRSIEWNRVDFKAEGPGQT